MRVRKSTPAIFILFLGMALNVMAQTDFIPGYIITNEKDSIHGFIDYRGDILNSARCVFKTNKDSEPMVYLPSEINSYRFTDSKYYISKKIPKKEADSILLFLEFLVNGEARLYYYRDRDNSINHYFIEKKDNSIYELTNEEVELSIDGQNYVRNTKRHIGVLMYTFSEEPELYPKINEAKLNHKSLISLTKDYHELVCEPGETCMVYEKKPPIIKIMIGTSLGMTYSLIKFHGYEPFYDDINLLTEAVFDPATHPIAGIRISIDMPGFNEKLSLIGETQFENGHYYSERRYQPSIRTYKEKIDINLSSVRNNISLAYNYPKGKLRPTAFIGGSILYIFNQNAKITTEYMLFDNPYIEENNISPFSNASFGYTAGVGINYMMTQKRIMFLSLSYDKIQWSNLGNINRWKDEFLINSISLKAGLHFLIKDKQTQY